jgi:L-threonylcarbamoyladenylate synthase
LTEIAPPGITHIDPLAPEAEVVAEAARHLRQGRVVVVPTRHLYGLAADACNAAAVAQVFALKRRPTHKALPVLIDRLAMLERLVAEVPPGAEALMARFWPGRLTLVFRAAPQVSAVLTGRTGKIGIRMAAHPVCRALLARVGRPLTATSANLSGQPGCHRVADLPPALIAGAAQVLDAGPLLPGVGSSVVDVTAAPFRLIREGAIAAWELGLPLSR